MFNVPVSMPRYLAALTAFLLLAPRAIAGPLDDPHVGDTGFSGPTTGDLTAMYWNPAGLGLLQGPQIMVGGAWQLTSVSVARTSIDPATGTNPGATSFPTTSGSANLQPFRWPPGPSSFLGIGAGIGHRFGIALAMYSPYSAKLTMNPVAGGQEPARYHLVSMDFNHVALAIGIAIHISDSIQFGVAPGLLFPTAHLVFDEDTGMGNATTGSEAPANAARFDLASKGILVPSYFVSGGLHYTRGRLSIGLAYTSAPLGNGGIITVPTDSTNIAYGDSSLCTGGAPSNCVFGQMTYRLPSMFTAGATWQATPAWSATAIVRYVRNSGHDKITILVAGPTSQPLLGTTIPDHIALYRGFTDSFDLRGRVVYGQKNFRLGATLRLETSAVPAGHVNAAAIDGTKLEPSLAGEIKIWRGIRLAAGYAFTWMLPVSTGASVFDPTLAATCAQAAGDLANPACRASLNGQGRPTAAGDYRMWRQTLSVLTTFGF